MVGLLSWVATITACMRKSLSREAHSLKAVFNRLNVGETRAAMEAATDTPAPAAIEARFQALWPKHRDALVASLEARRIERTKNLEKTLSERAEKK